MTKTSKAPVKARQRYSASYKSEALAPDERIGVPTAAKLLGLQSPNSMVGAARPKPMRAAVTSSSSRQRRLPG